MCSTTWASTCCCPCGCCRPTPTPTRSAVAAALWAGFADELAGLLGRAPADAGPPWDGLAAAVDRALAWAARLDGPLDRAALIADLAAVGEATRAASAALEGDR